MSYPQDQVIRFGAAPNPSVNTPFPAAEAMADHWAKLATVYGIFINTTVPVGSGAVNAEMIDVHLVEPPLDANSPPLFYQVLVSGTKRSTFDIKTGEWVPVDEPSLTNYFAVCQWGPICASIGVQAATIQYLALIDPNWKDHPDMVDKVYALPTLTFPAPIVTTAPVLTLPPSVNDTPNATNTGLASPYWNRWVGSGWLAIRPGDTSPYGTVFQDAVHGKWVKKIESPTPFSPSGSNPRWELMPPPLQVENI